MANKSETSVVRRSVLRLNPAPEGRRYSGEHERDNPYAHFNQVSLLLGAATIHRAAEMAYAGESPRADDVIGRAAYGAVNEAADTASQGGAPLGFEGELREDGWAAIAQAQPDHFSRYGGARKIEDPEARAAAFRILALEGLMAVSRLASERAAEIPAMPEAA
jgi:hypothetical protein